MPTIDHFALPRQLELIQCNARNILIYGGFGSAKTRGLCLKLLHRASFPGAREGLYRKHLVTLKGTTLRTLLDGDGKVPPILPPGSYVHNKSEKTITLKGGGQIVYFGLDDPDKARSLNLTGACGDEATELTERDYLIVDKRCRVEHPLGNQHYSATNPHTPSHFLARIFGLAGGHTASKGHVGIHTMPEDNARFLPRGYIDGLKAMTGLAYKRYYLGLWVGADGLVYENWDRELHVSDSPIVSPSRVIVGVDDGFKHPFAACRVEFDGDGRGHVAALIHRPGMVPDDRVEAVRAIAVGAEAVLVDPSAPTLIELLARAGVPVQPAFNDVKMGIGWVSARLRDPGDGRRRLTISPTCEALIREFETYEWQSSKATGGTKDKPKKECDDGLDALRYAIAHVDHAVTAGVVVDDPSPKQKHETREDDGWPDDFEEPLGVRFIGM